MEDTSESLQLMVTIMDVMHLNSMTQFSLNTKIKKSILHFFLKAQILLLENGPEYSRAAPPPPRSKSLRTPICYDGYAQNQTSIILL